MSSQIKISGIKRIRAIITGKDDSLLSKYRISSLLTFTKDFAVSIVKIGASMAAVAAVGISAPIALSVYSSYEKHSNLPNLKKDHNITFEELKDNISSESLYYNEKFDKYPIIIVAKSDKNIVDILANIDKSIDPNYGNEKLKYGNVLDFTDQMIDKAYHYLSFQNHDFKTYNSYINMNTDSFGPHALSVYENDDKNKYKVCYLNPFNNKTNIGVNKFSGQNNANIFFNGYEVVNLITAHEVAHCLDLDEASKYSYNKIDNKIVLEEETLQGESLADIFAALKSIKITGNTDSIKYTLIPFRAVKNSDDKHQSTFLLQKFINDFNDFDKIKEFSEQELFEYAKDYYSKNNVSVNKNEREERYKVEKIFRQFNPFNGFISNTLTGLESDISFTSELDDIKNLGNGNKKSSMIDVAKYGKEIIEIYSQHLAYHDKSNDLKSLISLAKIIHKTAIFDNNQMVAKDSLSIIEDNESGKGTFDLKDKLSLMISSMNMNFSETESRYTDNLPALENEYKIKTERVSQIESELKNETYDRNAVLFIDKNPRIKDKLIEKHLNSNLSLN
jgi:hypothetical protein